MIDLSEIDIHKIRSLVNKGVHVLQKRQHTKASEIYIDVIFEYPEKDVTWEGSVPIEYRRTGVSARSNEEIAKILNETYFQMHPDKYGQWLEEQTVFWEKTTKPVTKPFFEVLKDSKWKCRNCDLPDNPNWARRHQDIKEFGYTTSTNTRKFCVKCNKNTTHVLMLPVPRGEETGYETWSARLRERIINVLGNIDAYEGKKRGSLLPDHKFPEIRWDENTRENNPDDMGEDEIKKKFQLLSNQRNQEKREACRKCFQTGKRGYPFGIKFFYNGDENWPANISKKGKNAENGCIGCGWYDLNVWRKKLNESIQPCDPS